MRVPTTVSELRSALSPLRAQLPWNRAGHSSRRQFNSNGGNMWSPATSAAIERIVAEALTRDRTSREDHAQLIKKETHIFINETLERERLFRENHAHLVKAELQAFIEQRLEHYFRLRQPVIIPDHGKVLTHTNDGHRLYVDMQETSIALHIIETGEWERHVQKAIRALLSPGGTFVDVGANIGVHALLAASVVGSGGKVLALEPHPRIRELLVSNVEINGLMGLIEVFPYAASDESGKMVEFDDFLGHSAMSGFKVSAQRKTQFEAKIDTITVETLTVDDLLRRHQRTADVVKIDVEGFEALVIRGCAQEIASNRNVAFIIEHDKLSSADVAEGRTDDILTTHFSPYGFEVFELGHDQIPKSVGYAGLKRYGAFDYAFVHPDNPKFATFAAK